MKPFAVRTGLVPGGRRMFQQGEQMNIYIYIAAGLALVGLVLVLYLARKPKCRPKRELESFNFDKSKSYEKDGRKYPFSY